MKKQTPFFLNRRCTCYYQQQVEQRGNWRADRIKESLLLLSLRTVSALSSILSLPRRTCFITCNNLLKTTCFLFHLFLSQKKPYTEIQTTKCNKNPCVSSTYLASHLNVSIVSVAQPRRACTLKSLRGACPSRLRAEI